MFPKILRLFQFRRAGGRLAASPSPSLPVVVFPLKLFVLRPASAATQFSWVLFIPRDKGRERKKASSALPPSRVSSSLDHVALGEGAASDRRRRCSRVQETALVQKSVSFIADDNFSLFQRRLSVSERRRQRHRQRRRRRRHLHTREERSYRIWNERPKAVPVGQRLRLGKHGALEPKLGRGENVGKEDNDLGYQTTKRACSFECQKYGSIHGYGCCELRPDNINDPEKGSCHYFVDGHEEYGKNYLTMKCTKGGYLLIF